MPGSKLNLAIEMYESSVRAALVSDGRTIVSEKVAKGPYVDAHGESWTPIDAAVSLASGLQGRQESIEGFGPIGLAVDGWLDVNSGIWKTSHPRGLWINIDVVQTLQSRLGAEVRCFRLGDAVAMAEQRFGLGKEVPSFLSLYVSQDDVNGGLVVDGTSEQILRGSLGHLIVDPQATKACRCGVVGSLSAFCSGSGLADLYKSSLEPNAVPEDSVQELVDALAREGRSGLEPATNVFKVAGQKLAEAVVGLITGRLTLGVFRLPARSVVIGAAFDGVASLLAKYAQVSLASLGFPSVQVEIGALGGNAPLIGAALAASGFPQRKW